MGYVDVCLEKKKGRFWRGEAGAGYLPSCWWTAVVVVLCGVVLYCGSNSLVVPVRKSIGVGLTGKAESGV